MPISVTFTIQEDDDYGTVGYMPDFVENANAFSPDVGMAHDILEHRICTEQGAEGEMQALGCILWGRGLNGLLGMRSGRSYIEILAGDVYGVLENRYRKEETMYAPRKVTKDIYDEVPVCDIEKIVRDGIKMFCREQRRDDYLQFRNDRKEWERNAVAWMIDGYGRAERYYLGRHKLNGYELGALVEEVGKQCGKQLPKEPEEYLGLTARVTVYLQTQKVVARVIEPRW
jgi:hypothetical protein